MSNQRPAYEPKLGGIKAAVWIDDKGAKISFGKSYKDNEGNWKNQTVSLFEAEAVAAVEVLKRAIAYLAVPSKRVAPPDDHGGNEDLPPI